MLQVLRVLLSRCALKECLRYYRRRVIRLSKNTIVPTVPIVPTNKEDQLRTDYEIEHAGRKRDARDASGTQGGEVASRLETLTMLA